MIEDLNLNLLSGGFFRCGPAWTRPASSIDRCYKVYFPVSGAARLEMESGSFDIRSGRIYFISGFHLARQICERRMEVYWLHFVPESLYLRHLLDQLPPVQSWSRADGGWPAGSYADICRVFEQPFSEQNRPRGDLSAAAVCRICGLLLELVAHRLESLDEVAVQKLHPGFLPAQARPGLPAPARKGKPHAVAPRGGGGPGAQLFSAPVQGGVRRHAL